MVFALVGGTYLWLPELAGTTRRQLPSADPDYYHQQLPRPLSRHMNGGLFCWSTILLGGIQIRYEERQLHIATDDCLTYPRGFI